MNRHSNTYDTGIQDTDDYEYLQAMSEIYGGGYSPIYTTDEPLTGCQRLRSERALDVFELEKLRNGK